MKGAGRSSTRQAQHQQEQAGPEPHLLDSLLAWDKTLEETLVGWALAHPESAPEFVADVKPGHFHSYLARTVATAIQACAQKGEIADVDGVARALERLNVSDVKRVDLIGLYQTLGIAWEPMAHRVRDAAHRRALHRAMQVCTVQLAHDDLADVRASLYRAIDMAEDTEAPIENDRFDAVMARVWERYREGSGAMIETGFKRLDAFTRGVARKTITIIGARTSVGKSALACTLAANLATRGFKVSYISAEMDQVGVGQRYVGVLSEIPILGLSTGDLAPHHESWFAEVATLDLPLATDDTCRTITEVRARAMRHRRLLGGLDVLFVDYVQLLGDDTEERSDREEKRHRELGRIARGLRRLAKELNIVVFAMAQLSRQSESRREPSLKDLRESGDLEQDADVVWLLWRDERSKPPRLKMKVAKNRQGPTGRIELGYLAHATKFSEIEPPAEPEPEPDEQKPKGKRGKAEGQKGMEF